MPKHLEIPMFHREEQDGKTVLIAAYREEKALSWLLELKKRKIADFIDVELKNGISHYRFTDRGQVSLKNLLEHGNPDAEYHCRNILHHLERRASSFRHSSKEDENGKDAPKATIPYERLSLDYIWIDEGYGFTVLPLPEEMSAEERLCLSPIQFLSGVTNPYTDLYLFAKLLKKYEPLFSMNTVIRLHEHTDIKKALRHRA